MCTIFLFSLSEESVLCDLKALLVEAKQRVPPFLTTIDLLNDDLVDHGGHYHNTELLYSFSLPLSLSFLFFSLFR